jgi:hypothetical protein
MTFLCPVCGYDQMDAPPRNYEICSCCGTEFGNDDAFLSHSQLRQQWLDHGAPWFFRQPPLGWNPYLQLMRAKLPYVKPRVVIQALNTQHVVEAFIQRNPPEPVHQPELLNQLELVLA